MDLESLKNGFDLLTNAISILKQGKDLIPQRKNKIEIEDRLNEAEEKINLAKAKIAKELGYDLCKCTFPPQIMLFTGVHHHYKCPKCGHEIDKSPAAGQIISPPERKHWLLR